MSVYRLKPWSIMTCRKIVQGRSHILRRAACVLRFSFGCQTHCKCFLHVRFVLFDSSIPPSFIFSSHGYQSEDALLVATHWVAMELLSSDRSWPHLLDIIPKAHLLLMSLTSWSRPCEGYKLQGYKWRIQITFWKNAVVLLLRGGSTCPLF